MMLRFSVREGGGSSLCILKSASCTENAFSLVAGLASYVRLPFVHLGSNMISKSYVFYLILPRWLSSSEWQESESDSIRLPVESWLSFSLRFLVRLRAVNWLIANLGLSYFFDSWVITLPVEIVLFCSILNYGCNLCSSVWVLGVFVDCA